MSDVRDPWNAGSTYESFMGRWSRRLAPRFVSWLGIPGRAALAGGRLRDGRAHERDLRACRPGVGHGL